MAKKLWFTFLAMSGLGLLLGLAMLPGAVESSVGAPATPGS